MARYTIKASDDAGELHLMDPLTIDQALHRAVELRDKGFRHIILTNTQTGAD